MSELSDLYQEVILDHNKKPRNFREIADAVRSLLSESAGFTLSGGGVVITAARVGTVPPPSDEGLRMLREDVDPDRVYLR